MAGQLVEARKMFVSCFKIEFFGFVGRSFLFCDKTERKKFFSEGFLSIGQRVCILEEQLVLLRFSIEKRLLNLDFLNEINFQKKIEIKIFQTS